MLKKIVRNWKSDEEIHRCRFEKTTHEIKDIPEKIKFDDLIQGNEKKRRKRGRNFTEALTQTPTRQSK